MLALSMFTLKVPFSSIPSFVLRFLLSFTLLMFPHREMVHTRAYQTSLLSDSLASRRAVVL